MLMIQMELVELLSFPSFEFFDCLFFEEAVSILLFLALQSHHVTDIVILFTSIFYVCDSFGVVFLSCETSQWIINAFEEIEHIFGEYRWYLFPDQVKQMLPMMLMNVQKPIQVQIFGSLSCCREAFKRVSNP